MGNPIDSLGDSVRQVIRAYHGSPYDFDKFDASKIGTGEGAQAYGHGLYFAGNESIASGYRTRLAGSYSPARLAPDADLPAYFAPGNVINGYGGRDKVLNFHQPKDSPWDWSVEVISVDKAGNPLYGERPRVHRTTPSIDEVDRFLGRPPRRPGHTYEVEIPHSEKSLLDWDSPISEQPHLMSAMERIASVAPDRQAADRMMEWLPRESEGEAAYHAIADAFRPTNHPALGLNKYKSRSAAAALLQEGIPGIQYLDSGSRKVGRGTRNYVMFPGTEDQIRILRKYGLMAPVAAGAAAQNGGGE